MPNFEIAPLRRHRISHRRALLQGASLGALLLAPTQGRTAAPFQSINQALALASHAAVASMAPAAGVTAAKQAQLGAQNLATAAARFRSLSDALTAAATAANTQVANGLAAGGLEVLEGTDGKTPAAYTGATAPSQATDTYNVTIKQTQALAQLAWKTFNIGAKTHLTFDQTSGGATAASWIAINSVRDPLANPSQILGSISAVGKVYVLNRNGIAFGTGATINVGSLIAATADIASSQLSHDANGLPIFSLYGAQQANTATYLPTFVNGIATSTVTVAPGASLQAAPASGTTSGGYVYLFGGNVTNAGLIGTPQGQTVLAAGTEFTLRQGSQGSTTAGNTTSTTLGSEVAALNTPVLSFDRNIASFPSGSVTNTGVVIADQGDISLVGHAITQAGVLFSTTTVNTRGTIHLLTSTAPPDPTSATDPLGLDTSLSSVTLAPESVTEIIPEDNGATALDSQRAANIAASATLNALRATTGAASSTNPLLNNHSTLPDQFGESRIEISGGGTADLQPGAIAIAPGGQVAIGAAGRILVETGAAIDVSGSTSAVLPSSVNDILVNVQPYQLRDSAANRDGGLKSTNVYVDARTLVEIASGAYGLTAANPLGNIYTPGGLFEVGGYLGLIPHGITEWTAIGGQVTLQSSGQPSLVPPVPGQMPPPPVNGEVITQPGSVINLTGGTVTYAAGPVHATYVQSTDGVIYNANTAPGNLVYTGLYTGDLFTEPRWRISQNFVNPLLTPSTTLDPSYVVGRDAGTLTVSAPTALLQGSAPGGVTLGQDQTAARPAVVSDPYLLAQNVVPLAGALQIGDYASGTLTNGYATAVLFESAPGIVAPSSIGDTLATGLANTATIDAGQLNADGFARLTVTTIGDITAAAPVSVADGGSISLAASTIEANAGITARGGAITLTNGLTVGGSTTPIIAPIPPSTTGTSTTGTSTSGTSTSGISTSGTGTAALPPPDNIVLATGAALDARGVWTNAAQDPVHVSGEALVNGGTVTIDGVGGVNLQAGGRIDVSSGGAILAGGRSLSGAGGSITVIADLSPTAISQSGGEPVTFDSTFVGYGSKGAGTLSLTAPDFRIGTTDHTGLAPDVVVIGQNLFQSGFASYALDGTKALSVLPGAQITVAEPIYEPLDGLAVPTGGDPSQAYSVVLPPLFTPVRGGDTATQRGGASLSLSSDIAPTSPLGGGFVTIGAGATVAVDPLQSIIIAGHDRITVFGTLTAHGGTVEVANTRFDTTGVTSPALADYAPGISVWIDSAATIDVSGQATVFSDPLGRRFGSVSAGGTIELGGYGGLTLSQSTWAQVIVRPGAVLDADGASAEVDLVAGAVEGAFPTPVAPVTLVSNGGTLIARSLAGIALDGTFSAHAGGAGAAGGALYLRSDPTNLTAFTNLPLGLYQPSQVLITQDFVAVQPADLTYNQITPDSTFGLARISQAQIDAGGIDQVSLFGADIVAFDGASVQLHAGRSITLAGGIIGATSPTGTVSVTAPYVDVTGYINELPNAPMIDPRGATDFVAPPSTFASLTIQADLLDLQDQILLGGTVNVGSPAGPAGGTLNPAQDVKATSLGFAQTNFGSTGDIRFLGATATDAAGIESQGNLLFTGAQLYPVSNQRAAIYAGVNLAATTGDTLQGGTITVQGLGGDAPQAPYAVAGALALVADTIVQDGIIRAPQGQIRLGYDVVPDVGLGGNASFTSSVQLGAGSVTSVSLAGQTIPYGGTVDGVNYPNPFSPGGNVGVLDSSVELAAQSVNVEAGALIDLRGGGTLSGAGFVVGRGGSADVLKTPLLAITGGAAVATGLAQTGAIKPANTSDGVYAILPSYQSAYAPATGAADSGYSTPGIGARITVGSEVPGLAAGTYTLLPAYYALLPGGFRVELSNGTLLAGNATALGNFSVAAPVTTSIANTSVAAPVQQAAIFTSGENVRQLSQYDEESYNTFEATTGTQFGAPRPFLPQDGKTLLLNYPAELPNDPRFANTLRIATGSVQGAPDQVAGGYGYTAEVTAGAPIDIAGPGDLPRPGNIQIPAEALSALDAPRLLIGGTIGVEPAIPDIARLNGATPGVSILPTAVLTAGDIMLTSSDDGSISVLGGATLSTLGSGPAAYDLAGGFYFSSTFPVLDVSNGQEVFLPVNFAAMASITVGDRAALLAGGSLNFIAPGSTSVSIGAPILQAKYADIQVGVINVGALPAGSGSALPSGLALTPQLLAALLPAATTTSTSVLTLTATQEVNFAGTDPALDSGLAALVLNTSAVYGFGSAAGTATIASATSVTWSGVAAGTLGALVTATPGGQIEGSTANVEGALAITAPVITLGVGPQTQPDGHTELDRLAVGFASVTLDASQKITANNQSALTVFETKPDFAGPGLGGTLTLNAPLVTTDPAAVLKLSAGGSLSLISASPAATGTVTTLGGEIDLASAAITVDTAVALPAGRLTATADTGIDFGAQSHIDLSGRVTPIFDQNANSPGGTLVAETGAGGITQETGSIIDVSAPAASAGAVSFSALAGSVDFSGSLSGTSASGGQSGSFSVLTGTLPDFAGLNALLDAGGFHASRSFEIATGDLAIAAGSTVSAQKIAIAADAGSIDIAGTLAAYGTTVGSITISAGQNLTLEASGVLDAHATQTAHDFYGQPIDAENRAHVTLTAASGTLALAGGTIDVSYPGEGTSDVLHPSGNPQGQVVFNAPRLDATGAPNTAAGLTYGDVALSVTGVPTITGAASIALYATGIYTPTDANGTIAQDNTSPSLPAGALGLNQIGADSTAFIGNFNTSFAQRLGGLGSTYGATFHVRPGVIIESGPASTTDPTAGDLTITGDLDFSGLRYANGADYGTPQTGLLGSGEPGSVVFRAANQLIVNGSVSDGFAPPPDSIPGNHLSADAGWVFLSGHPDPLSANVILPSSISVTTTAGVSNQVGLAGADFGPSSTISVPPGGLTLSYAITIRSTTIAAGNVTPIAITLGADSNPIPAGGWVATAAITGAAGDPSYAQGAIIPQGTILHQGTMIAAGTVLPVDVQTPVPVTAKPHRTEVFGTTIPAGTPLGSFGSLLTLSQDTAALPANALIPAGSTPDFINMNGKPVTSLDLRPVTRETVGGHEVQGRLYPLATLLPTDSLSWNLDFVAGADQNGADATAVTPASVLNGGALAAPVITLSEAPGSLILDDQHYYNPSTNPSKAAPAFSVIRTGTGDLSLVAGGNFDQSSLYGIYTAGTQTSVAAVAPDAAYDTPRNPQNKSGKILPGNQPDTKTLNGFIGLTPSYYPNDGGDVLVSAQGDITGDGLSTGNSANAPPSDGIGSWLWRQGSSGLGQATAWWINYGTVANTTVNGISNLELTGFQGIGALGGGNVTVAAGVDGGGVTLGSGERGQGLIVAVGSTGRVLPDGSLVLTGGGTETVQVGDTLNPVDQGGDSLNGDLIDLRGNISLTAGAVGQITDQYGAAANDPRSVDPFTPTFNTISGAPFGGGPNLVPGDGTVAVETMRNLVVGGAGDPGRVPEQSFTELGRTSVFGTGLSSGGETAFSLWTDATSITLFSAGGNVTPTNQPSTTLGINSALVVVNDGGIDGRILYPATLLVTAATGSIAYGSLLQTPNELLGLETAPSPDGQIAFLAGTSIFGNAFAIDISGAPTTGLSTPLNPTYYASGIVQGTLTTLTNIRVGGATQQTTPLGLFSQEADTPAGDLHAADTTPALFYAAGGDIVDFVTGQTITFPAAVNEPLGQWYIAAKPVRIIASEDIVSSGTRPDSAQQGTQQNQQLTPQYGSGAAGTTASGDLFLNTSPQSISVVSAGRDILSGYFYVGGPGTLEVDAGRNLFQAAYNLSSTQVLDFGAIRSLGPLITGSPISLSGGANLAVVAGIGSGPDYSAFSAAYLNPANQANLALPTTDPSNQGKVQLVYTDQLTAWLQANYPTLSLANGAYAAFQTLPQIDQDVFLRDVFFDETLAGGRQYNDPTSRFFGSYVRGRQAIDTLFPSPAGTETTPGVPFGYTGAITMLSGPVSGLANAAGTPLTYDAGVSTAFGGTIQVLDPGGEVILGTAGGPAPGAGSGLITNGTGDIDVYALDSVLLGKSRIFTTAGGNIQVWSSQGDINAGIGARTTIVFTPPILTYDNTGGISETPAVPTNGAGIATLAPLPDVPLGNVDLTAPLGTIDAGEAGIRVSGNLNLAAARLANTANITVAGKTTGNAPPPSVSLGAVEAAGAAAGASTNAAQTTAQPRATQEQPSIVEVEVLGLSGGLTEEEKRKRRGL